MKNLKKLINCGGHLYDFAKYLLYCRILKSKK